VDKILIIDDSPVQAEYLCSILTNEFETTVCHTAREGLEKTQVDLYSLILLDIIMPDMDGFALLRQLQEQPQTKYIPVILITSLSDIQNEERGLLMGAVDYITKPFNPVIVRARVNTHIRLYHYQRQFWEQAMLDGLTGVANRRQFDTESIIKWREAIRLRLYFSIIMMDVDKFKLYNDAFGHPAGDKVLIQIAQVASSHLKRVTDLFARYGGEEFVILLVGDSARPAFEHMKAIRQAVEDLHIPAKSPISPWVTISMGGVTFLPKDGDNFDSRLKLADTMLYDAKRLGCNQVIWSNEGREQWRERE